MNTIKLKDYTKINIEENAAAAITPGMLVELTSAGKVQAHSNAGQDALTMIALEDDLQGNDIDDAYSTDNPVQVWIPNRGCEAYMILATSQTIAIGDFLSSNGNGMLKKHVPDASEIYATTDVTVYGRQIIGQAIEAKTTTSAAARIKVRII